MAGAKHTVITLFCALALGPILRGHDNTAANRSHVKSGQSLARPRSLWAKDPPPGSVEAVAAPAVISRDSGGSFHVNGLINGRELDMTVDTGAEVVAIPVHEAANLGITIHPDEFEPVARTASGTARGEIILIDSLTIGGTELRHVPGMVIEGLDSTLLGQSALRQLGTVNIRGDRMEIIAN